jgi:hypothetical protein
LNAENPVFCPFGRPDSHGLAHGYAVKCVALELDGVWLDRSRVSAKGKGGTTEDN